MNTPTTFCSTCGSPTDAEALKKCSNCWELEGRLEIYLRNGGDNAKAFVLLRLGMPDTKEVLKRLKKWLWKERARYQGFAETSPAMRERAHGEAIVCTLTLTKIDQIYKELKEG